jgi:tetratricopeptide (TPR) repeat protein
MAEESERQRALDRLGDRAIELREAGKYAEAERLQRQILKDTLLIRGLKDRATLWAKGQLASTLWHLGRHDEAARDQEHLMAVYKSEFGWDDVGTLGITGHLVTTYISQGRDDEAKALATELLLHKDRIYGKDSAQSCGTNEALASICHNKGNFAEAADKRKRILDSVLSRGEDRMTAASAYGAYGVTLLEQGRLDDSKHNLVQAVELSKAAVGSEHPKVLAYQSKLLSLHFELGDFHAAVRIGGQVLRNLERSLGEGHHETISSMSNQAASLLAVGERVKSQALIDRAVKLARDHLGTFSPSRSSVLSNAAAMYRELGLNRLASELSFESYDSARRVRGDDSPETLSAMMECARCSILAGILGTGWEGMKLCVERTKRKYGPDHPLTMARAQELADLQKERGKSGN